MLDIALKNVFRQKVRSVLTILGIAMGIGLILALGSIGEGLNQQITESVRAVTGDGISDDIIDAINNMKGVEEVIPVGEYRIKRSGGFHGPARLKALFTGSSGPVEVLFTAISPDDQDYLIGEEIVAEEGRKLDDSDSTSTVIVMGYSVALSNNLNLGDEIEYNSRSDNENDTDETYHFEVIGILEETGDTSIDEVTLVPMSTMQEIEDDDTIKRLKVKIEDVDQVENVEQSIKDYTDDVRAFSMMTIVRTLESTLSTVQMAVYGIAAISVIVGGIGIMNTMIMTVMERRREIGVMKAIGATTTNILTQVLEESAILSLIGGVAGLLLGYGTTVLVGSYTDFTPILTTDLVAMGLGFSIILGMGAGLYPAWAASQLDPIEVLRYE